MELSPQQRILTTTDYIVYYVCRYDDDRLISTPNRGFVYVDLPIDKSNQSPRRLLFLAMFSLYFSIFEQVLIDTAFLALCCPL